MVGVAAVTSPRDPTVHQRMLDRMHFCGAGEPGYPADGVKCLCVRAQDHTETQFDVPVGAPQPPPSPADDPL